MRFGSKIKACATALALILLKVPAYADPTVMLGLSLNFGGGESKLGATAKLLSNDAPNEFVGAAGITYFFDDGSVGLDAGLGYTFDNSAVTFTYDFLNESPQLSAGWADIAQPRPKSIDTIC
jgi:hypothetical protein